MDLSDARCYIFDIDTTLRQSHFKEFGIEYPNWQHPLVVFAEIVNLHPETDR